MAPSSCHGRRVMDFAPRTAEPQAPGALRPVVLRIAQPLGWAKDLAGDHGLPYVSSAHEKSRSWASVRRWLSWLRGGLGRSRRLPRADVIGLEDRGWLWRRVGRVPLDVRFGPHIFHVRLRLVGSVPEIGVRFTRRRPPRVHPLAGVLHLQPSPLHPASEFRVLVVAGWRARAGRPAAAQHPGHHSPQEAPRDQDDDQEPERVIHSLSPCPVIGSGRPSHIRAALSSSPGKKPPTSTPAPEGGARPRPDAFLCSRGRSW